VERQAKQEQVAFNAGILYRPWSFPFQSILLYRKNHLITLDGKYNVVT